MTNFHYTYVMYSLKDNKLYIGQTDDLNERIKLHNFGQVQSTKSRLPLKLIYFEGCLNKEDAVRREKSLKSGFGRKYIKSRLDNYIKSI